MSSFLYSFIPSKFLQSTNSLKRLPRSHLRQGSSGAMLNLTPLREAPRNRGRTVARPYCCEYSLRWAGPAERRVGRQLQRSGPVVTGSCVPRANTGSCGLQEHHEEHRLGNIRIPLGAWGCSSGGKEPASHARSMALPSAPHKLSMASHNCICPQQVEAVQSRSWLHS